MNTPETKIEECIGLSSLNAGLCGTFNEDAEKFCDSHCTWLDHHPDCTIPVGWLGVDKQGEIGKFRTSPFSGAMPLFAHKEHGAVELLKLLADIKAWDVDQYMIIPHELRARMEAALTHNLNCASRTTEKKQWQMKQE